MSACTELTEHPCTKLDPKLALEAQGYAWHAIDMSATTGHLMACSLPFHSLGFPHCPAAAPSPRPLGIC
eukprot:scaffold11967_cov23-Tisochrysis_lutea.AAC.1